MLDSDEDEMEDNEDTSKHDDSPAKLDMDAEVIPRSLDSTVNFNFIKIPLGLLWAHIYFQLGLNPTQTRRKWRTCPSSP